MAVEEVWASEGEQSEEAVGQVRGKKRASRPASRVVWCYGGVAATYQLVLSVLFAAKRWRM